MCGNIFLVDCIGAFEYNKLINKVHQISLGPNMKNKPVIEQASRSVAAMRSSISVFFFLNIDLIRNLCLEYCFCFLEILFWIKGPH